MIAQGQQRTQHDQKPSGEKCRHPLTLPQFPNQKTREAQAK